MPSINTSRRAWGLLSSQALAEGLWRALQTWRATDRPPRALLASSANSPRRWFPHPDATGATDHAVCRLSACGLKWWRVRDSDGATLLPADFSESR
jgi:hypothetical protein